MIKICLKALLFRLVLRLHEILTLLFVIANFEFNELILNFKGFPWHCRSWYDESSGKAKGKTITFDY